MDIYTGPVGQASVTTQIHDYSPPIAANGLFWTVPISPEDVAIDLDSATASYHLSNFALRDAHDLKNSLLGGATVPATVSFDVEWSGAIVREKVTNEAANFTGQFIETIATINWSASQAGFSFVSEAPNPARNFYSVIGHERNGSFFHPES